MKKNIVIIDDHKIFGEGFCSLLEANGFIVKRVFQDPILALNYFEKNKAIDIVFTDINMPKVNGIELIEKIKKIGSRFLNIEETEVTQDFTDIKYLTKIWTAKEALYKIYSKPGINFRSQLRIQKSSKSGPIGLGSVNDQGKIFIYNLYFRYFKKFCITLATTKF